LATPLTIKTLHLTNAFNEQSGGIATFYRALIEAANRQQRQIRLVVPAAEDRIEPAGEFGRIYYVKAPKAPLNNRYRILYPPQFLFFGGRVQKILRDERPDVVEICDKYNLNYLGAVLRLGLIREFDFRPLVVGLSCERMDDNFSTYLRANALQRWFCAWYMHWIYFPFFDHHIAVSRHTADELVAASKGHAVQRRVWVRHMGVDVEGFSPDRRSADRRQWLCKQCGAAEDTKLLLYVGRFAPEKNLPLLIQVVRKLSERSLDCRLILVGDGIELQKLQTLAQALAPGQVYFLGHVEQRDQLADIYANCDVFVHPNPREPFGIAPLEAMASGIPLVAPDEGGITSFATTDNAFLVHAGPDEFFSAVIEALDGSLAAPRVAAALKTAQDFRWDLATDSYLGLYEMLHQVFRGEREQDENSPYFLSTKATKSEGALISTAAWIASKMFRGVAQCQSLLQSWRIGRGLPIRETAPAPKSAVLQTETRVDRLDHP
jgi:alpha-1,6-mannosyltransferase